MLARNRRRWSLTHLVFLLLLSPIYGRSFKGLKRRIVHQTSSKSPYLESAFWAWSYSDLQRSTKEVEMLTNWCSSEVYDNWWVEERPNNAFLYSKTLPFSKTLCVPIFPRVPSKDTEIPPAVARWSAKQPSEAALFHYSKFISEYRLILS